MLNEAKEKIHSDHCLSDSSTNASSLLLSPKESSVSVARAVEHTSPSEDSVSICLTTTSVTGGSDNLQIDNHHKGPSSSNPKKILRRVPTAHPDQLVISKQKSKPLPVFIRREVNANSDSNISADNNNILPPPPPAHSNETQQGSEVPTISSVTSNSNSTDSPSTSRNKKLLARIPTACPHELTEANLKTVKKPLPIFKTKSSNSFGSEKCYIDAPPTGVNDKH